MADGAVNPEEVEIVVIRDHLATLACVNEGA